MKNSLIEEYKNNGLIIRDFHLGKRIALSLYGNIVLTSLTILMLLISYHLYETYYLTQDSNMNNTVLIFYPIGFIIVLSISYLLFTIVSISLLIGAMLIFFYNYIDSNLYSEFIPIILYVLSTFLIALIAGIISYNVNKKITIKDEILKIPASDVEQSILDYFILKPIWGLLYPRSIPLADVIKVNIDGYGSKKDDIYPVIVIDKHASNRLVFTSRQKREEFREKVGILINQKSGANIGFGESEAE